ncbi:helix-turn-helix transcriptional regulator [Methanogenium organophilum]|uniref:Helix-turn-helix domain-containing protein n=1 Tax=Methanogenium organophilum TaxID=2199 RepID=A0A9X9T803_METOG|nr:helix-turn-helix domain-containing protein [Methanogenium organophilum]WAI00956.1 helix-turn-helix domain-containing protein [Methanogenium organophilum]
MMPFGTFTQEAQLFLSNLKEKEHQILLMLNEGRYQAEIAEKLHIDKAQVSRFIRDLKRLGLVEEDVTVYEHKGKTYTCSRRPTLTNKIKYYNLSPYLQEYIASLSSKNKTDTLLYDVHHINLYYPVTKQPDCLYLKEIPPDPQVEFIKKWHPNGCTFYRFQVTVITGVMISIIYRGSSISASRLRGSRLIRASNQTELMKIWKKDVEAGVRIFIQYQKIHGKKISVGTPEDRGEPHYAFFTKYGKMTVGLPKKTITDDIYIDNSPSERNPDLSEIETENSEVADQIDRGIKCALRMPEIIDRIQQLEKEIKKLNQVVHG